MRTTIEFPPTLLRAAKMRSAERGESLKALLSRAVSAELGLVRAAPADRPRVVFPLFGATGPRVNPSNADLERALAEAEAEHLAPARPPRRRRSPKARS